jgi:integrase
VPPRLTIHDLRASFATNYLEENPDRFWRLMELLGHTSPSSTCLYIRSRGERVETMKKALAFQSGRPLFATQIYNTTRSEESRVET